MTDERSNREIVERAIWVSDDIPGRPRKVAVYGSERDRLATEIVAALAAAGRLVTPEQIVVPRPRVPHGPAGIPAHVSDADYLREGARHLRGGYPVGGSNLTATVAQLLDDAAAAIEKGTTS